MKTPRSEVYQLKNENRKLRAQARSLENRLETQTQNYDRLAACFAVVRRLEPLTEITFELLNTVDVEVNYDFQHRKAIIHTRKKPF